MTSTIESSIRLHQVLSRLGTAIQGSGGNDDILTGACKELVDIGQLPRAWIVRVNKVEGFAEFATGYGEDLSELSGFRVKLEPPSEHQHPILRAIHEGSTVAFEAASAVSALAAPISNETGVIGVLCVQSSAEQPFDTNCIAAVEEAAMLVAIGLAYGESISRRHAVELQLEETRYHLQLAQEQGHIGGYELDLRGLTWVAAPILHEIFGVSADHPNRLAAWYDRILPSARPRVEAQMAEAIAHGKRFVADYPIVRLNDGAERWVSGLGDIELDEQGQPLRMVGTIQDITERVRAGEAVRMSAEHLRLAALSAKLGVWELDLEQKLCKFDARMCEMHGILAESAVMSIDEYRLLVHPDNRDETFATIRRAIAEGLGIGITFRIIGRDQQIRTIRSDGVFLRNADGVVIRGIGLNRDLTEELLQQEERRKFEASLQQTENLRSLGRLAGGIAHDLNNVLGAILGQATVQRAEVHPEASIQETLDSIIKACLRGRGVVSSLLCYARRNLAAMQAVDLNALLIELIELLRHTTLQKCQFKLDLAAELPKIRGDEGALSHAVMNLCLNAVDAMPAGGVITLRSGCVSGESVVLTVQDEGVGMSPDVLAQVLEPFFTTKPQGSGTGLGLSMVHSTVEAHGGTMIIHSEVGQGTTIRLQFPVQPASLPDVAPQSPAIQVPALPLSAMRILLVDDDAQVRSTFQRMLKQLGHQVTPESNGEAALRAVAVGPEFDVIMLDMNMPGMTGKETLRRIKETTPNQLVLLATGYTDEDADNLIAQYSRIGMLRKPFTLGELREKLAGIQAWTGAEYSTRPRTSLVPSR